MRAKSILILKSQEKNLTKAEDFLKNRGWVVMSTTDIRMAMEFLLRSRPTIALVSIDVPDTRLTNFTLLMQRTYGVTTIKFTETNSIQALNILVQEKSTHAIRAAVTGPAIERAIHQALAVPKTISGPVDGLIRHCSLAAAEEAFGNHEGLELKAPEQAQNLESLIVESDRFSGIFVSSICQLMPKFKDAFHRFTKSLSKQFRQHGEPLTDFKAFTLNSDWQSIASASHASTIHLSGALQNYEVELFYFPMEPMLRRLKHSKVPGLLSCSLDWIESETLLEFDVLIHLQNNKKSLTYLRRGDRLSTEAKDRLKKRGIESVYIQESEADNFFSFQATSHIARIHSKSKLAPAVS